MVLCYCIVDEPTNKGASRRQYLVTTAAAIGGSAFVGTATADEQQNELDKQEFDTGLLISRDEERGLQPEDIQKAQKEVVREFVAPEHSSVLKTDEGRRIITSDIEKDYTNNSSNNLVAYYASWKEKGGIFERKFRAPSYSSKEERKKIIENATKK